MSPLLVSCRRYNAINHSAGEQSIALDPLRQIRIDSLRKLLHHIGQRDAIIGQVIATQRRKAFSTRLLALGQGRHSVTYGRTRSLEILQIMDDVGMLDV